MIDAVAQARIQELFRRENRSFLQYICESTPWSSDGDRGLLDEVRLLAAEEMTALEHLARWMDANRIPIPYLGAYPIQYTSSNFVDIRKLLQPLVLEQRKEVADLEKTAKIPMDEKARNQIEKLAALNRKHLENFEMMIQSLERRGVRELPVNRLPLS